MQATIDKEEPRAATSLMLFLIFAIYALYAAMVLIGVVALVKDAVDAARRAGWFDDDPAIAVPDDDGDDDEADDAIDADADVVFADDPAFPA
jgi:hypothetical protein